jgi:protein-disulfide isomerase
MKKTIVLMLVLTFILAACGAKKNKPVIITPEEAKIKTEKFINENLVSSGQKAEIKDIKEENGIYKITVALGAKEIISYLTLDGSKFFPSVMDIAEIEKEKKENKKNEAANKKSDTTVMPKKDKPEAELFVMSHCPYGTQIEKGIIPAIEALGDKIDFKLKFVDYAMHGEKEINEQLNQYCLQKEEPDKLLTYLNCFLKEGNGDDCLKEAEVNLVKLNDCVAAADKEFKVKEKFNNKNFWSGGQYPPFDVNKAENEKYGVQGSPTLVINGSQSDAGRDSKSLLEAICSGFNNKPAECSKELSAAAPSPGFGFSASGGRNSSSGGCGQ